jgi:hypothetical protein
MDAAIDLQALRQQHGGQVYSGGRRWIGPGPGHSRRDTSLSVWINDDGRPVVHSFAGDAFGACAQHLGLELAAPIRLDRAEFDRQRRERQAEAQRRDEAAMSFCARLWDEGVPIEGSLGQDYLRARAIDWTPGDLRYNPATRRGYSSNAKAPAILAAARSSTGTPKALQATFLMPDHRSKTNRVTFGKLVGCVVRLAPATDSLAIAEGMETAASYARLECVPAWASLGTANLEAFDPPARVRRLIIAADGDDAGQRAALALAERVRSRCDVTIHTAPRGFDWNDVMTGRARA